MPTPIRMPDADHCLPYLRVVGDADGADALLLSDPDPLVLLGVERGGGPQGGGGG